MLNRKELYKKIIAISLPIVISNLLESAVTMADVLMTNFVGQAAISATSLAGQFSNIAFMVFFGINAGVTMLGSQYWGKHDLHTIQRIQGIALRFSMIFGMLLTAAYLTIPELLMRIYTPDPELIRLGAVYLRIVAPGTLCWSIYTVFIASMQTVERVRECTVIRAITLAVNVVLNAVLIIGVFGLPKMGVYGIALATSISNILGLAICIFVSVRSRDVKLDFREMFRPQPGLLHDYVTMAVPAAANDISWGLAFSMYSVIFGHLGSDVVAANSIVSVIRNFGCVLCFGIGSATSLILGQYLGRGEIEEAKKAGRDFLLLSVAAGVIGGLVVFAVKPLAVRFANISEKSMEYLIFMLNVNCFYIMGTAVNTTLITGVFRAGGDSKFGMICDTIDMWGYAVPLGLIAAFVLHLPVKVVYILLCTDEFVKWPWVFKHYFSYKWARNITREELSAKEN